MFKYFILSGIFIALILTWATAQDKKRVCIRNVCLRAEIADSDVLRQKGLMFRKNLGKNDSMLFIFPEPGDYGFWMKNMQFPLDIIWISQDKEIVGIKENIAPCQSQPCPIFKPGVKAKYVLEVCAAFVNKHKIRIKEKVSF